MSTEKNKALYRRLVEEGMNGRNLSLIEDLVAADFIGHWLFDAPPMQGRDGFRQWVSGFLQAMPDWHGTLDQLLADGDTVVARWTVRGTQTGEWRTATGAIPPTGKALAVPGIHIARFVDGKLVELWHSQDRLGMFQQLGLLPAQSPAAG